MSGGEQNTAAGLGSSISGGYENTVATKAHYAWIGGGRKNKAAEGGWGSSISGGKEVTANNEFEVLPSCVAPGKAGELC